MPDSLSLTVAGSPMRHTSARPSNEAADAVGDGDARVRFWQRNRGVFRETAGSPTCRTSRDVIRSTCGPFPSGKECGRSHAVADGRRNGAGTAPSSFSSHPTAAMMAASISVVRAAASRRPFLSAFSTTGLGTAIHNQPYAVAGKGQRFLIPVALDPPVAAPINVVMDWPGRLPSHRPGRDGSRAATTDFGPLSQAGS